jgi:hypothetical protein
MFNRHACGAPGTPKVTSNEQEHLSSQLNAPSVAFIPLIFIPGTG